MSEEVEVISDGTSVAVFGRQDVVERFLASLDIASDPVSDNFSRTLSIGSVVAATGSTVSAESGRWLKLTSDSAKKLKEIRLTPTETPGVSYAMLGKRGSIKKWLKVETGAGARFTNPAVLAGAAGLMAQLAMQQQIDAITDYLEVIDEKLNAVLKTQVNQVLARLDGVDLAVREGLTIRDAVGRVSEVTWSKIQASAQTIHEVQGFAIRQLADLVDRIEVKKISELHGALESAESEVKKWLFVLARCFELLEKVGILELDRVLDADPEECDRHRMGLQAARIDRLGLIRESTERVLHRMQEAITAANSKVLFNPIQSPAIVRAGDSIATEVLGLRALLEIESAREEVSVRRWSEAASDGIGKVRVAGAEGLGAARRLGEESLGSVRGVAGRISERRVPTKGDNTDSE